MTGVVTAVPPPPPGPGVQPPFVAPPTDGTTRRRWVAVGISIGLALLLCLGGVASLGGLLWLGVRVVQDESQASVRDYLTALRDQDFDEAYGLLCPPLQANTSRAQFARTQRDGPQVASFEVAKGSFQGDDLLVPAEIDFTDGSASSVKFVMFQDQSSGAIEVCGTTR
jgi:hypothetical protein